MNKKMRRTAMILSTAFLLLAGSFLTDFHVRAAQNDYERIPKKNQILDAGKIVRAGNYYFDCSGTYMMFSDKKDGYYQVIPNAPSYGVFTNGKKVYYDTNDAIYEYHLKSRKLKKLDDYPKSDDSSYKISGVFKNKMIITKSSFKQWDDWTYFYDIKKGTFKKVQDHCDVQDIKGIYVAGQNEYRSDAGPYPITIYRITSSGLKKIKKLTNYGRDARFIGNHLYYSEYEKNMGMKKVTLYKCSKRGGRKTKIKTFYSHMQFDSVMVNHVTAKYCVVYLQGKVYRYTYKTGKMQEMNNDL